MGPQRRIKKVEIKLGVELAFINVGGYEGVITEGFPDLVDPLLR